MLALIKREIEDNVIFFIIAVIAVSVLILMTIYSGPMRAGIPMSGIRYRGLGIFSSLMPLLPFVCAALGAAQTYSDRTKKISTFLSTLTTTRRRILVAKITAGLLWIALIIVPFIVADVILIRLYPIKVSFDVGFYAKVTVIKILICLASYCVGLQMGCEPSKFLPVLGSIALTAVLISAIFIKGLGIQIIVILSVVAAVSLIRVWHKFMTAAL